MTAKLTVAAQTVSPGADRTPEEFMGAFFGMMGDRASIKSHPPHATLKGWPQAWPAVVDLGWVTVEDFNKFGVFIVRPTAAGISIAREQARKAMDTVFGSALQAARGGQQ